MQSFGIKDPPKNVINVMDSLHHATKHISHTVWGFKNSPAPKVTPEARQTPSWEPCSTSSWALRKTAMGRPAYFWSVSQKDHPLCPRLPQVSSMMPHRSLPLKSLSSSHLLMVIIKIRQES